MNRLFVCTSLILLFLVCSSEIWAGPASGFSLQMEETVKGKLDPSILMEFENLKKEEQLSKPLKIIVKTKGKMNDFQKKQIEEVGLIIGSILGDIFTATGPLPAVLKTASFDFVIQIQLSKELKQK
jgi:hypothetical protein